MRIGVFVRSGRISRSGVMYFHGDWKMSLCQSSLISKGLHLLFFDSFQIKKPNMKGVCGRGYLMWNLV